MKLLVWHWGRRGGGPLFALRLAAALGDVPGHSVRLSLAGGAEILAGAAAACSWREPTYETALGYALQRLSGPLVRGRVRKRLIEDRPDIAICAMPALLDARMTIALRRLGIPYAMVVHDAAAHPGEAFNFRIMGQWRQLRDARVLFALTGHVEDGLRRQGYGEAGQGVVKLWHPPVGLGKMAPVMAHGGVPRLLCFGRLLPYKGLGLLAGALERLGPERPFQLRVCGEGPDSPSLARLRAIPEVSVEQRWVSEAELPALLAWADAVVLPYQEASQSGVAALAIAAGRYVLATSVGGLPEQLAGVPGARLCAPTAEAVAQGLMQLTVDLSAGGLAAARPLEDAAAGWPALARAMLAALKPI
ncbi:glycosyltransferase family 4 protein [Acidocella sp.]|uniref:glycosyltransferase family 4 protein n=1 Tax=Acidocella sp. TaxID=50710 RepID=UPI0026299D78|nr:glycosyltransferase family 4 protein [Acidocella sp.]MDD2794921.1 glycosyltransferase family 4 protein [Acidocella sp.]